MSLFSEGRGTNTLQIVAKLEFEVVCHDSKVKTQEEIDMILTLGPPVIVLFMRKTD